MSPEPTAAETIVLIHGFWVTPRSWEHWIARYEGRGHRVLAPAYPGFEVEVEALNADPTPIEQVTVPQIIEHLESIVSALDSPAILIGHSAGGVFTQVLLDHGFGAAGVAINSAPTEGVKRVPLSQIRASFPVLKNPANRHKAVGLTFEQWKYTFTNGFAEDEARRLYERYHIPASGEIFWGSALANIHPGKDDTWVELRQRRAGAAAVYLRQQRPPDAAVDPAVQRQALQVRHGHRGQGVRGAAPAARLAGLGAGRRLRAGLGAAPRPAVDSGGITHVDGMSPPATLLMWFQLRSPELAEDFERLMTEDRDIVRGSLDTVSDWRLTRPADVPGQSIGQADYVLIAEIVEVERFEQQASEHVERLADDLAHLVSSRGMLVLRPVL